MSLRKQTRHSEARDLGFAQYNRIELLMDFAEQFARGGDGRRCSHETLSRTSVSQRRAKKTLLRSAANF
jgi:hypothetical protein